MSPCSVLMESELENLPHASPVPDNAIGQPLPLPGTEAYEALPQFPKRSPLPFRRTIRRQELRQIVPLAETTIYEMERRGEFPRRFNLTPRCVVWDLDVSADGKLTHPADRKLTHLGRGWRPLGGRLDVDPGGSSGSEGVGPSGQRGA